MPDGTDLWEWILFLSARAEEDLEMVKERNAEIRPAVEQLYRISANDKVRHLYEMREKAWRDEQARLDYSRFEGIQEGIEQGLQRGRQEGMEHGLQQGLQRGRQEVYADMLKLKNEGLTVEQIIAQLFGSEN